ncbi:MAG: hypothetical protein M5R40_18330 [Anaerolineae bacterium]|nr:hypothetical protein [Anaerolineae bacterium]
MEHISSLLLVTIFIVALLLVLFAIFKPRTIYEGVLIVILVLILIFYYARELEALILIDLLGFGNEVTIGNFEGENSQDLPFVISRALDTYHKFILDQLPEFNGISVFGNIWFNITINRIYVTTIYPIVILGSGIIIRLVINRFILNKNLRRVGREYAGCSSQHLPP